MCIYGLIFATKGEKGLFALYVDDSYDYSISIVHSLGHLNAVDSRSAVDYAAMACLCAPRAWPLFEMV